MTATILHLSPPPMHFDASTVEQTARLLAVADGVLTLHQPLASLNYPTLQHYRGRARLALAGRHWHDAERFAREYTAQVQSRKTFDQLPANEQADIAHVVHLVATALEAYMDGTAEPITDWHRQHTAIEGDGA